MEMMIERVLRHVGWHPDALLTETADTPHIGQGDGRQVLVHGDGQRVQPGSQQGAVCAYCALAAVRA
jgi:hypothetical protein